MPIRFDTSTLDFACLVSLDSVSCATVRPSCLIYTTDSSPVCSFFTSLGNSAVACVIVTTHRFFPPIRKIYVAITLSIYCLTTKGYTKTCVLLCSLYYTYAIINSYTIAYNTHISLK